MSSKVKDKNQQDDVEQDANGDLAEFVKGLDDDDQTEEVIEETTDSETDESNQPDSESETANDESNEGENESDEIEAETETEGTEEETEVEPVVQSSQPVLTSKQEQKLEIDDKLSALYPKINKAENLVASLKKDSKEAKDDLERLQRQASNLISQIYAIDHGGQQFLPLDDEDEEEETPHPDVEAGVNRPHGTPALETVAKELKKKKIDPGIKAPISELELPNKAVKDLEAKDITTIGELEERIRNDAWWHKKVPGIGESTIDKITDALTTYRLKNPPPDNEDEESEQVAMSDEDGPEAEAELSPDDSDEEEKEWPQVDPVWFCDRCQHKWPAEDDNQKCPKCSNEDANQKLGFFGSQDVDEKGVIVTGTEVVDIIDTYAMERPEGVECYLWTYETEDGQFTSGSSAIDPEKKDNVHFDALITNNSSQTIEEELFYQAGQLMEELVSELLMEPLVKYRDELTEQIGGEWVECTNCQTVAVHREDHAPPCRFCKGEAFVDVN